MALLVRLAAESDGFNAYLANTRRGGDDSDHGHYVLDLDRLELQHVDRGFGCTVCEPEGGDREEVAATMVERDPDFEDEKLRLWQMPKEERPEGGDEALMAVDLEREDLYESRVYPLLPHTATLLFVAQRLSRQEPAPTADEFQQVVDAAIAECSLKVLAKCDRSDGRISYLVVAVSPEFRSLVERGEVADDAEYRGKVTDLEEELLAPGLIGEPLVVSPEEWRRYQEEHR